MTRTRDPLLLVGLLLISLLPAKAQYPGWAHHGTLTLLTTPEGAALPASAVEHDFPVLVRLNRERFDFAQAQPHGEDLRFATADGAPLAYEIDAWDAIRGTAAIWVRIPEIHGNAHQALQMFWGRPDARSESNGAAVFNASNGYVSVWHMNDPAADVLGATHGHDTGTTPTAGRIGAARHFEPGKGIQAGEAIAGLPTGSTPHSTEAWFRAERSNATILAWGNEAPQGKVVLQYRSPPHINLDCYFSGANVSSESRLTPSEWVHVAHTYRNGESRVYVNGALDGLSTEKGSPLALKSPAHMDIGGWYGNFDFTGDIDEVRLSNVTRSADWVRLEYENQKPLQTLVGPLIQPGSEFGVSPERLVLDEGRSVTLTARAGGAEKIYWILKRGEQETVQAVDTLHFTLTAGRVTGDTALTLRFKAITPDSVRIQEIPVTIREAIPDPAFTLSAPSTWNGRKTITIATHLTNQAEMQAASAGEVRTEWKVSGGAVLKETEPGKLILIRAQNSGTLTVTATLQNGGAPMSRTVSIRVREPKHDAWVERTPAPDEKPEAGQFYATDDRNEGTLFYNGAAESAHTPVFLRIYADGQLYRTLTRLPAADRSYRFSVKLKPGLIKYRVEFGTKSGRTETVQNTVDNLVCGDAFLIDGQSNALATDTSEQSPRETSDWIRSYGNAPDNPDTAPGNLWCSPVWKAQHGEKAELGWWGMELAKRLVARRKVPIFLLNAAVGGTRIDQHQRNVANPTDLNTIYGRMLWRLQHAKLTHGIRGILWHQGENDQGADGPTGGFGWETYQSLFVAMAADWKRDFPNVQRYYVFQIWPNSCSMSGRNGSGDRLREQQRTLPRLFSNLSLMSTLGIRPAGGCHYPLAGWSEFARLIEPVIERDNYGEPVSGPVTAPNLKRIRFGDRAKQTLLLEFDQPVVWQPSLVNQFYLDGLKDEVASGLSSGNRLVLRLKSPTQARTVTYLKEIAWSQDNLLMGANGIAALTFCEAPIE